MVSAALFYAFLALGASFVMWGYMNLNNTTPRWHRATLVIGIVYFAVGLLIIGATLYYGRS